MKAYLRTVAAPAPTKLLAIHTVREYLNQCLQQGGWGHDALTPANWRTAVREQLLPLNWPLVMEDVGSFIIDLDEQPGFSKQQVLALLDDS